MYMTGRDGVAVSSYAFDDFGRNVDPFTGKIKEANHKHSYTTDGNIIQPFAFTGYQEDEVSGLKFAQARFYSAENGRFVGEDQVKGSIHSSNTLNRFIYCENSPIDFVDVNGKWLNPKEFTAQDGAAVGLMTVGTVAAAVGAIAIGAAVVASAPVSLPLIAAGAVVGAGVAFDASVISDWKNDKHANLKKGAGNAAAGALIGGTLVSGAGAVMTSGGASLETVGAAIVDRSDVVTGVVGGITSTVCGESFGSGFWSSYANSKVTDLFGKGYVANLVGGSTSSIVGDMIRSYESGNKIDVNVLFKKAALTGALQMGYGGFGGHLGKVFDDANGKEKFLFFLFNDLKNQGILDQAASIFIDHFYGDKYKDNNCEEK